MSKRGAGSLVNESDNRLVKLAVSADAVPSIWRKGLQGNGKCSSNDYHHSSWWVDPLAFPGLVAGLPGNEVDGQFLLGGPALCVRASMTDDVRVPRSCTSGLEDAAPRRGRR